MEGRILTYFADYPYPERARVYNAKTQRWDGVWRKGTGFILECLNETRQYRVQLDNGSVEVWDGIDTFQAGWSP